MTLGLNSSATAALMLAAAALLASAGVRRVFAPVLLDEVLAKRR